MGEAAIEALQAKANPDVLRLELQACPNPMGGLRLRIISLPRLN